MDGSIVGIGAFYSGKNYLRLSTELVWQVLHFYPLTIVPTLLWRTLQLQALMPAPAKNMHYVANFAVRAEMQSKQIGCSLLCYQQEIAKQLGRDIYALDVSVANLRAQAFYERLGFKVIRRQQFKGKKGSVADTLRMEMPVNR